ncbi:F-box domain containing protein [Mycena venus]|uniref:F-box domain containing protein n=1 Tax=Mycena venus TaxID=2733690 RepID=A0A8H6XNW8_9AGAR|nr:F-box domain containing protein [Mycena venus]
MAEIALINIDKCEVVDPSETGHEFKVKEVIANRMTADILWLFTVPADNQPAPAPSPTPKRGSGRRGFGWEAPAPVPVGHWAGDRVLIVDEYVGSAAKKFPADLLAKFPDAEPREDALDYALEHLKHVGLAKYEPAAPDALFPADRIWVVRNLTKHWYARSDALFEPKYCRGPTVTNGLGLSELIWAKIGGAMGVPADSVGHRFDIQTLEVVENPEDGKEWVDKSKHAKRILTQFDESDDVQDLRGES